MITAESGGSIAPRSSQAAQLPPFARRCGRAGSLATQALKRPKTSTSSGGGGLARPNGCMAWVNPGCRPRRPEWAAEGGTQAECQRLRGAPAPWSRRKAPYRGGRFRRGLGRLTKATVAPFSQGGCTPLLGCQINPPPGSPRRLRQWR